MQSAITPQNWTHTRYESGVFRAFISFGADPESLAQGRYLYFLTLTEGEDKEIHQEVFPTLSEACIKANQKFSDWQFIDQNAPKSGCSSCVAH
jgi:hypothetical protein